MAKGGGSQSEQRKKATTVPPPTQMRVQNHAINWAGKRDNEWHRENLDKGEKEELGALRNNVASCPSQLCLQGRRVGGEHKRRKKIASAEQVRGGCADLWILLSQFSESLCYKGRAFSLLQVRNKGWVEFRKRPWSAGASGYHTTSSHHVSVADGNGEAVHVRLQWAHICYPS